MNGGLTSMSDGRISASTHVPRRFVIGALIAGGGVGVLAATGMIGVSERPRAESFRFVRGSAFAAGEKERLEAFIHETAGKPRRRIRIIGHSGTEGPADANLRVSQERAEAVMKMVLEAGIDRERITYVGGIGGSAPLPRQAEDSDRGYQSRLARIEIETYEAP